MSYVITIGRQFGSGGHAVAEKLSELLAIKYYDKNIIDLASEKSGISKQMFENSDEKHNSFLYSLSMAHYNEFVSQNYLNDIITNDKLFMIQSNIIKDLADKESCIFVGRCADYVLADHPNKLSVFIHAGLDSKVNRVMEQMQIKQSAAETLIKKTDKSRAAFYNFYSSNAWGAADTYDVCLSTDVFGIEGAAQFIKNIIEQKFV
ncbi:MAG: cytidylate kinase-like family protein [Clostridia bacterium]|nr:cytidylate kinase-like family protein [Clostridia bacterium]